MSAREPGLQVERDPDFQRRDWRFQRVGWALMIAVIVAAFAGLLGGGPIAHRRIVSPDSSLVVEYDRIVRYAASSSMRLHVRAPASSADGLTRIWFNRVSATAMHIESSVPSVDRSEMRGDSVIYPFRAAARDFTVLLRIRPEHRGALTTTIGLVGHRPVVLRQYVLP